MELLNAQRAAKCELRKLMKDGIRYCMKLIEFNRESAIKYPESAAQLAYIAFIYRQLKTCPWTIVDGLLESGLLTKDESLVLRQLRSLPSRGEKEGK